MATTKRPTPEASVLRSCLQLLAAWQINAWRNNSGMLANPAGRPVRFGKVGSSDILGCIHFAGGRMLAIEVKSPDSGHKLTIHQWTFLDEIRQSGGVAVVVSDPVQLAEVLYRLRNDPGRVFPLPDRPVDPRPRGPRPRKR